MRYFNGFSLLGDEALFEDYLIDSNYCVAGFSYGAQQAFDYAYESRYRIERLILLSPAFFQNTSVAFKRTQLRYFDAGKEAYIEQFLSNISYPSTSNHLKNYLHIGTQSQLEALLAYEWDIQKIEEMIARGTKIEVFMGAKDKIVQSEAVLDFFRKCHCTCYTLNDSGHLLNA